MTKERIIIGQKMGKGNRKASLSEVAFLKAQPAIIETAVAVIAMSIPVVLMLRSEKAIAAISNNAIETSGAKQMLKLVDFFARSRPAAPGT